MIDRCGTSARKPRSGEAPPPAESAIAPFAFEPFNATLSVRTPRFSLFLPGLFDLFFVSRRFGLFCAVPLCALSVGSSFLRRAFGISFFSSADLTRDKACPSVGAEGPTARKKLAEQRSILWSF